MYPELTEILEAIQVSTADELYDLIQTHFAAGNIGLARCRDSRDGSTQWVFALDVEYEGEDRHFPFGQLFLAPPKHLEPIDNSTLPN